MWKLFKIFFDKDNANPFVSNEPSIHKLVDENSLNRRKNFRIRYPHIGAIGPYPSVYYKNKEMNVGNISVGGLLIIDDQEVLGTTVGETVILELNWEDFRSKIRCRIVGANLQRRHLQFVDFDPQAFLKVSRLLRPAHLGTRFHRVLDSSGQLEAHELWIGPSNESLAFLKSENEAALSYDNNTIIISPHSYPHYEKTMKAIPLETLYDIFVLVANLPEPSKNVKRLIETIDPILKSNPTKRTGTYG